MSTYEQDTQTLDPYTGEATNFYELLLPEKLTQAVHRCDGCGAQALHAFVIGTGVEEAGVLYFCSHHARSLHNSGAAYLAHKDYREPWDEYEVRRRGLQAEALKQLNAGKLDASNYDSGTSCPLHLSQWDRRKECNLWVNRRNA